MPGQEASFLGFLTWEPSLIWNIVRETATEFYKCITAILYFGSDIIIVAEDEHSFFKFQIPYWDPRWLSVVGLSKDTFVHPERTLTS